MNISIKIPRTHITTYKQNCKRSYLVYSTVKKKLKINEILKFIPNSKISQKQK